MSLFIATISEPKQMAAFASPSSMGASFASPPPKRVSVVVTDAHGISPSVFSPPTSPFDRAQIKASLFMSAAVERVVESAETRVDVLAQPQSLDLLLASSADGTSSLATAVQLGDAPTSLLVTLSAFNGWSAAPPMPAVALPFSAAAATVQRRVRSRAIWAQRLRVVEATYHSLVHDDDDLPYDAAVEMAQLRSLVEASVASQRDALLELDEFQEAHLDLELIRCDEGLAEADWARKFGDMVQRESESLSPLGRERAALTIQLAYRGMLEREAHAYDSDEFEFESEEEIAEEIEEGHEFISWASDDVYRLGAEPQGVTGAAMVLESARSTSFVALAALAAAVVSPHAIPIAT